MTLPPVPPITSADEMRRIAATLNDPAMQRFLADRLSIMQDGMSQISILFDEFGITEALMNSHSPPGR